jgi:hypothetical protein
VRLGELASWQARGYGQYHQTRRNLLVHIVAVPLFLVGNALVLGAILVQAWGLALGSLALSLLAFAAQGLGHKGEPIPSVPFTGAGNAVARIVVEQWVTFPRFVLSGEWAESYRRSAKPAGSR